MILWFPMDYSFVATGVEDNEHGEEGYLKRDDPNANSPSIKDLVKTFSIDRYPIRMESCFGKYLDFSEDNNAHFQMKIVYNHLKRRFMYENKDKMDEVLINYCSIPVCFGWKEFAVVTRLKCYPPSPSQILPTLTQNKEPRTPKKGKGKSSDPGLPWNLVNKVYIPINCSDEFHWVLAFAILKERHIRFYDSMSRRRHFGPLSEIQKLAQIFSTYLDMSGFLDQKVRTDWSTIEAYQGKMGIPFDVQYVEVISQQTIGSLDCGLFVAACVKYLSDGLQVSNDGLNAGLLHKRYAALLWKYGEAKAQKPYASDTKDPR
ncbi:hypothetical protein BC332_18724 [Capsicum chinense]|nr:hypothetical protein BC332_18724 [Capsicum chinense]